MEGDSGEHGESCRSSSFDSLHRREATTRDQKCTDTMHAGANTHTHTYRSNKHVVHESTKAPPVHSLSMSSTLQDFRCPINNEINHSSRHRNYKHQDPLHVLNGATESVCGCVTIQRLLAESKVSQDNVALAV